MTVRRMSIVRCPGTMDRPMLKVTNSQLEAVGFTMGTPVEITYQEGLLIVKKMNHEPNNVQKPASPVTNPAASSGTASAEDGAGRTSDQGACAEIVQDSD